MSEYNLNEILAKCKKASLELAKLSSDDRNQCLKNIKKALIDNTDYIVNENKKDIDNAINNNYKQSLIDRLKLDEARIKKIAESIDDIINLDEVVNITIDKWTRPNGLIIEKISVPFGVLGVIFESRPNVCVDISVLCLKTANACVLKGGKEAINSNIALAKVMNK